MENKTFFGENKWAVLFTVLVLAAGTAALGMQGYFAQGFKASPMAFADMEIKIVFDDSGPQLLAYMPASRLSGYTTLMGDPVPGGDSMVLGYEEARDMTAESNVTISEALWGYEIRDFIGQKIRVSGMLKKTGSLIDMMHLLPRERFERFGPGEGITVKLTDDKMPKFFYTINQDGSNWPRGVEFEAGGLVGFRAQNERRSIVDLKLGSFGLQVTDNRTYLPLVLGSKEAEMMREEGLFSEVGDRVDGFFGGNVVIAGVLKLTGTALDMLHYMPAA